MGIYATKNVQPSDLFLSQTQEIISLFKQTTRNAFLLQIAMFRQTMSDNALFSAWLTNFYFKYLNATDSTRIIFYPFFYTSVDNDANITCSCKFAPDKCDESTGIYNFTGDQVRYVSFHWPEFSKNNYIIGVSVEVWIRHSIQSAAYPTFIFYNSE